jgi:GNAT superfamily N-acetyltransferase
MAERLLRAARHRLIMPEHLETTREARLRVYVALIDERIVGWVRSVVVGDATWVASMHVVPAFRRRGIGKTLLAAMLRDDRATGSVQSVLLASRAGARLYTVLGYRTIATLYLFKLRRT